MKRLFIALLVMVSLAARSFAASSEETEAMFDRIKYEIDYYDNERKITYLGQISLSISDYTTLFDDYSEKDSEFLKLIVREKDATNSLFPRTRPRDDIKAHFLAEVKRLFRDLPFHDLSEGRAQRLEQFRRDNPQWDYVKTPSVDLKQRFDAFNAAELARANALYGGRAGTVNCDAKVKRRTFPILYEIGCSISAEEGFVPPWREDRDIGFSTLEHIDKEIKQAITRMLEKKSSELKKIKQYGKR